MLGVQRPSSDGPTILLQVDGPYEMDGLAANNNMEWAGNYEFDLALRGLPNAWFVASFFYAFAIYASRTNHKGEVSCIATKQTPSVSR